jgi:hypothetical protein
MVVASPDTPVVALRLSADGGDTASTFAVRIDSIEMR